MPKYMKLAETLIYDIERMEVGDSIPSERELSSKLGLSRTTVRLAMQYLEQIGYIETSQGKKRVVKDRAFERIDIGRMFSFTEEMLRLDKKPSSIILKQEIIEASDNLLSHFNLPKEESKLYYLQRLRLADDEIMMLEDTFLPFYLFQGLYERGLAKQPLYDVIQNEYEMEIVKAEEEVTAITPDNEILKKLKIHHSVPLLQIIRTTNNSENQIIEYTISVARGDKFSYKITH